MPEAHELGIFKELKKKKPAHWAYQMETLGLSQQLSSSGLSTFSLGLSAFKAQRMTFLASKPPKAQGKSAISFPI